MRLAGLLPAQSMTETPLRLRDSDTGHDWSASSVNYPPKETLVELFASTKHHALPHPREYLHPNCQLSEKQKKIVDLINLQLHSLQDRAIHPPRRIFVQGKAGTGKSKVIAATFAKLRALGSAGFRLMAPTGIAANNIQGQTIHTCHIPPTKGQFQKLTAEVERNLRNLTC